MSNEMPLPPEIADIDNQIQTLELLKQGLDDLQVLRSKLAEAADVMGRMSDDLGGETLTFKDFVDVKVNEKTGELEWSLNTDKVDPLALDKTALPANLVAEAVRAQQALEEVMNPFGEHNSKLLGAMEKLSEGLDRGSEMFASVQEGIEQLRGALDMFDRAMDGDISGDELIEAFDWYFSTVLSVFENTIGRVPGLGALLGQYARGVASVVPDVKKLHARTQHTLDTIAATKIGAEITAPSGESEVEDSDFMADQSASLQAQIDALRERRTDLLDEHQREEEARAKREVDGIEATAQAAVQARTGYVYDDVRSITNDLQDKIFVSVPMTVESLRSRNPDDPRIADVEAQLAVGARQLREALGIRYEIEQATIAEIETIIRRYPHVLQNADLLELQNRYPQLGGAINDIRAERARSAEPPPAPVAPPDPEPAVSTAAPVADSKSRVPAIVAGGVAVAIVAGLSFFFFGGDPCEDEVAFGAVPGVLAAGAEDPCDDGTAVGVGSDDDVAVGSGNDEAESESTSADDDGDAATVGSEPVGKELPLVSTAEADGALGDFAGDVPEERIRAGLAGIRVWLRPSTRGGMIVISGGPDGESPTGELRPDGNGGYVWEDSAKNAYDVATDTTTKDSDEISDVAVDGFTMSFGWVRRNHDGTTWSADVSIEVPPDTKRWFESLPAPSDAPCTAKVGGTLSGDSMTVEGTSDCGDGARITVLLSDGQRAVAEVQGGDFRADFTGVGRNDSDKVVVEVARDCHWLDGNQIAG